MKTIITLTTFLMFAANANALQCEAAQPLTGATDIIKCLDPETGNICYIVNGIRKVSISCVKPTEDKEDN